MKKKKNCANIDKEIKICLDNIEYLLNLIDNGRSAVDVLSINVLKLMKFNFEKIRDLI
nr:hypothetical protein GTC16762_33340 [Pigmentibacter ruber]